MDISAQKTSMKTPANSNTEPFAGSKVPQSDPSGFGLDPQQLPERVAEKIQKGANILIALSKDPNVDEISAAIALAIVLDQQKKHVTAIYSGKTPNTLEFLKPEETFEKDTSSLQDFIIALNKSKADHLTYKLDGDYVKIYITPYKGQVKKDDLEYSYGDYNVDLVIVFNVNAGSEIDSALSEYGRIMHDASAINITSGAPGRFADLEWSDPEKSSVCEMVYNLLKELDVTDVSQEVATALLTGILSATERFSNSRTKPTTMAVASKLMEAGADQQLISANILKPETSVTSKASDASETSVTPDASSASEALTTPEAPVAPEVQAVPNPPITTSPTNNIESTAISNPSDNTAVAESNSSDSSDDLKELEQLVNQNLAQTANSQTEHNQALADSTSQSIMNSTQTAPVAAPLSTGNVMDELARMTESMTSANAQPSPMPTPQSPVQSGNQPVPQSVSTSQVPVNFQPTVAPQAYLGTSYQTMPQATPPQPQSFANPGNFATPVTPNPQTPIQSLPQMQSQPFSQTPQQPSPMPTPQSPVEPPAQSGSQPQVQLYTQPQTQPPFQPPAQLGNQLQVQPQTFNQQPIQTQAAPVNPLPSFADSSIAGHTISEPVIESNEDMSRLMDEVLAEPSPIQNPVGYQSLINQDDYINQSLGQAASPTPVSHPQSNPNPNPNPNFPLAVGQQPIANYTPGQNIATLSAPAMPTMMHETNYPTPEYTNNVPEYASLAVPTMPAQSAQLNSPTQLSQESQPTQSQPIQPQPSASPVAEDPMANFIQATPPATSTPIPDFLQPEAFLPPAPSPVVPNQPVSTPPYISQSAGPTMPLPPTTPEPLPTPPIYNQGTSVSEPKADSSPVSTSPVPNTTPQPQAPTSETTSADPSAFRIPGTY